MSPHRVERREVVVRFPRVSGDEPFQSLNYPLLNWFSPREWG